MTRYKHSFYTSSDNKQIFVQEWLPENDANCIILYVHGLGSHSGRLDHWAERFVGQDVGFIAYDQRGHGKSDGKRGHPKKVNLMVEDLKAMVESIRIQFPDKKVILYGHSMGGAIAINYVINSAYTVDGLIVTSPWLKLANPPSPGLMKILKPILRIAPGLCISNGLDPKDISQDNREVEKYIQDPLVHNKISIGLFYSTYQAGYTALRNIYKINCPFLIMHGTGDKITSSKASEEYVMNTSERTTLKLWEGAYHELHHEPIRKDVFAFITKWMKHHKYL
jgi:alpha-beta hydrolase superfamily lysophospholipase